MRWRRWIRNSVVMVLAVTALLVVLNLFQSWDRGAEAANPDRQSQDRQLADLAFRREHWDQAYDKYKLLTVADPFNGYAWYMSGICLWNQSYVIQDALAAELENESPDEAVVAELKEKIASLGERSMTELQRALEWSRYRNSSRIAMAAIATTLDRRDQALQLIQEAIDDGFFRRGGLQSREFDPLRDDPRFREMMQREGMTSRSIRANQPTPGGGGSR